MHPAPAAAPALPPAGISWGSPRSKPEMPALPRGTCLCLGGLGGAEGAAAPPPLSEGQTEAGQVTAVPRGTQTLGLCRTVGGGGRHPPERNLPGSQVGAGQVLVIFKTEATGKVIAGGARLSLQGERGVVQPDSGLLLAPSCPAVP